MPSNPPMFIQRKQKGAVLLALLMVFIIATSYSLVRKLNSNTREHLRQGSSLRVLNEAKAALIGYAVNYPLDHVGEGPGYLPCPDRTDPTSGSALIGAAGTSCSLGGGTTIGRFPWKTLELNELRDAAGEVIWYAVSDNYKNNPKVLTQLNSDSSGNFSVDGNGDIVAILFSAGPPTSIQDRSINLLDASNYLEDDNGNGDTSFVTNANGEFNDTVVTITRQELMSAVEKRVLGDVEETLTAYQNDYAAYPWLSSFLEPSVSTFRGANDTWKGHLPFHWSDDPDSIDQGGAIVGRNPFTTDIDLSWSITNANVSNPGTTRYGIVSGYDLYGGAMNTPDSECVENNVCVDDNYPGLSINGPITFPNASCTWSNKETFQCTGTYVNTIVNAYPQELLSVSSFAFSSNADEWVFLLATGEVVLGQGGTYCFCWQINQHTRYAYTETVTRTYTVDITYTDTSNNGADIVSPTNTDVRTRSLTVDSSDDASALFSTGTTAITITVQDDREIAVTMSDLSIQTFEATSTRTLTNDEDTTGSVSATGIIYDLDIDGYDANIDGDFDDANEVAPELPSWFFDNGWYELIYIAYPSSEDLPGNAADICTVGVDCLTVNGLGGVNDNVRALILSLGRELEDEITCTISGTITTANPAGDTLVDNEANFNADFIEIDDIASNINDGSSSEIAAIISNTSLSLDGLAGGVSNDWELSDEYQLSKSFFQDRTRGKISDYLENENCNQSNNTFQKQAVTNVFNDQVRIISTAP